jgi:hypothetical protein
MISRKINMPKKLKLKQKKFKAHTFDKSNRRKLELTIYSQKRNPYTQTQVMGETLNFNSTRPTHQNLGKFSKVYSTKNKWAEGFKFYRFPSPKKGGYIKVSRFYLVSPRLMISG